MRRGCRENKRQHPPRRGLHCIEDGYGEAIGGCTHRPRLDHEHAGHVPPSDVEAACARPALPPLPLFAYGVLLAFGRPTLTARVAGFWNSSAVRTPSPLASLTSERIVRFCPPSSIR